MVHLCCAVINRKITTSPVDHLFPNEAIFKNEKYFSLVVMLFIVTGLEVDLKKGERTNGKEFRGFSCYQLGGRFKLCLLAMAWELLLQQWRQWM